MTVISKDSKRRLRVSKLNVAFFEEDMILSEDFSVSRRLTAGMPL